MDKNRYHISSVIQSYLEELDYRCQKQGEPLGLSTGIKALDDKLGGLRGGEVVLLGSRPAMGKTSFAIHLSHKTAKSFLEGKEANPNGAKCVLYFSMEMPSLFWVQRLMAADFPDVPAWRLRNFVYGSQSCGEFEKVVNAGRKLEKLPICICDDTALSIDGIKDKIKEISQYSAIGFIIIDYLQLLYTENCSAPNWGDAVMRELKSIAAKLNIPILVLSQLNRKVDAREDKRPLWSDIREICPKGIAQIDKILFLYREIYYLRHEEPKKANNETEKHFQKCMAKWEKRCRQVQNECTVIIARNRRGTTGFVKCYFDAGVGKFDNWECSEYDMLP